MASISTAVDVQDVKPVRLPVKIKINCLLVSIFVGYMNTPEVVGLKPEKISGDKTFSLITSPSAVITAPIRPVPKFALPALCISVHRMV